MESLKLTFKMQTCHTLQPLAIAEIGWEPAPQLVFHLEPFVRVITPIVHSISARLLTIDLPILVNALAPMEPIAVLLEGVVPVLS